MQSLFKTLASIFGFLFGVLRGFAALLWKGLGWAFQNKGRAGFSLLLAVTLIFFVFSMCNLPDTSSGSARYRLVWTKDPETVATIGWDQRAGEKPVVYYGPEDHGRAWSKYPFSQTPHRVEHYKGMTNTFAELKGLQPDTAYYFVIKDSLGASKRMWFRTAPDTMKPYTFIVGGDTKSWPMNAAAKRGHRQVPKLRPLFVLFSGDFTTNGDEPFHDNSDEWRWWLNEWQLSIAEDGRIFPIVPVHGNHEKSTDELYKLFDLPNPECFYTISLGGGHLRIYVLNYDVEKAPNQQDWLQNTLEVHGDDARFKLAAFHTPFFPHYTGKSEKTHLYDAWAHLFSYHHMNFMVNGDTHAHIISYPMRADTGPSSYQGFSLDFEAGLMLLGAGSWGTITREINDLKPWSFSYGSFRQFKWMQAFPERFEIRTVILDESTEMSALSEDDPFALPEGISLFETPNYGDVLHYPMAQPEIGRDE
jgi:hypothetical protein